MATLQIEHPVTDLQTWRTAFDRFADARDRAGVRGHRIQRLAGDDHYLVIDLDFDTVGQAESFRDFLWSQVWSSPASAPALVGTPLVRILERVGDG